MSWSYRIALLYIGFVVVILTLVVGATRQKFDLVTPSYYADELKYEDRIQATRNAQALAEHPSVSLTPGEVIIRFPESLLAAQGELLMFHPQFAAQDIRVPIHPDANGAVAIPLAGKPSGKWRLKMNWKLGETPYYEEVIFVVP